MAHLYNQIVPTPSKKTSQSVGTFKQTFRRAQVQTHRQTIQHTDTSTSSCSSNSYVHDLFSSTEAFYSQNVLNNCCLGQVWGGGGRPSSSSNNFIIKKHSPAWQKNVVQKLWFGISSDTRVLTTTFT